jgi:hypothetical protein
MRSRVNLSELFAGVVCSELIRSSFADWPTYDQLGIIRSIMELLKTGIRRSKLGEMAYVAINAALPIVLMLLVLNFGAAWPALALVLLSKWRVFALRPRFWWINIKANLVDFLVGISYVGLLYLSAGSIPIMLVLAIAYGVWLLYVKPRSDPPSILLQAGIVQFVALTVLFSLSVVIQEFLVILGCFCIGYVAARHVVINYEEDHSEFISYAWGLVISQLAWLMYRWTVTYDLQLPFKVPQIALLSLVLSMAAARLYVAAKANRLSSSLIRSTMVFSVVLIAFILIFARWDVTI